MDSVSPNEPDEDTSASDSKEAVFKGRLKALADDLRRASEALEALGSNPEQEPDQKHFYAEAIRQTVLIRDRSGREAEQFAYLANAEPDRVSISRLATMLGISINTLRVKLPHVQQGSDEADEQPF